MSEAYLNPPKFQLSKFLGKNKEYQIVIRTETAEELTTAMSDIKELITGIENKATPTAQSEAHLEGFCNIHGAGMERKEGQYGEYWSHYFKDDQENGFYCNGKKVTPAKKPTYKSGWN